MQYLYVKVHNITGLKYLGKTKSIDPHTYPGSGKRWKRELEKYGYDYKTIILLATDSISEIKETGLFFSKLWNIVSSKEWANFRMESGDGGDTFSGRRHSLSTRIKMSESAKKDHQRNPRVHTDVTKQKITASLLGKTNPYKGAKISASIKLTLEKTQCTCPYCGKIGRGGAMKRFHFDNCKRKLPNISTI